MKNFVFHILLFSLVAINSCQSPATEAMKYNDQIVNHQVLIIDAIDSLENSFRDYKTERMNRFYSNLTQQVQNGTAALEKMNDFEGDKSLLEGAKTLFSTYQQVTQDNYPQIIKILSLPDSSFTREDQQNLFDQQTIINDKLKEAHQNFLEIQNEFGKNHQLTFSQQE